MSFNGASNITHYGTCSTAAATAAKVVSLTGFTLVTGATVKVKFTVTNTASSPTLNVNSTGAKAIMYRGSAISAGYLAANRVYEFVYDGTDWELVGDINTNTTYSAATTSANGLMTAAMVTKLNGITDSADSVAFSRSLSSGTKIGTITINGTATDLYCETNTNTDTKVTQSRSNASNYRALLMHYTNTDAGTDPGTTTNGVYYNESIAACPSTGTLKATTFKGDLDGNAATATNVAWSGITSKPSYYDAKAIKSITRSGTTFTYTCLDGTTGTFTQQDSNTTYSAMTGATSSAAGKAGLVPVPAAGKQASFLRGDGTWAVPTNTTYSVATQSTNGLMSAVDKKKIDSFPTPQQYGAKANGTTDDTAAFNSAIAAHNTIYIPSGSYKITTLTYPTNKKIIFIIEAGVTITQSEPASIRFVNGGNRQYYTHDTRTSANYNIDFNKINKMTSSSSVVSHNVRFQEQNLQANDKNFHWNVTAITDDYTVGTNGTGENVAFYSQMNSYSDGKVWAGCFEINERQAQEPVAPKIGIEITAAGGGNDPNYSRIGLDISAHHTQGDGYAIGTGIRLAGALGSEIFKRAIHARDCQIGTIMSFDNVSADYGIDFRGLNKQIPVMLLGLGNYISFSTISLLENSTGLNILKSGSSVVTVNDSGMDVLNSFEVLKDGAVVMGASTNGIVLNRPMIFNTAQMNKTPTNKTTPATWANVKININGTLTDYYIPLYS